MKNDLFKNLFLAVLAILFLVIIHISIENFGSPVVTPTAYLIWIGISLFVLISAVYVISMSTFTNPLILKYILLFICLNLLTGVFNPMLDYHSFLYKALGLMGGVVFFVAMHQFKLTSAERDKLLFIIFISGVIEAGIGIIQYLNPYLRLPMITPTTGAIYGSFQQVNLFTSFIATSIVISLFLISRPLFKTIASTYKAGFYILVALLSFVLFLSYSIVGFIGAVLGVTALFISRIRIYKGISRHILCWLFAVVIGISISHAIEKAYFERKPQLTSKFQDTVKLRGGPRILSYKTAYEMFKDKPLFGHGFGNFGSKYMFYQREVLEKQPEYMKFYSSTFPSHPHNEILYRLAESGVAGGAGLLILVSAFGFIIFKSGRERGGLYVSLLLPIGFHTQVEYPLYQSLAHFMLFLILCYLPSSHFSTKIPAMLNRFVKSILLVFISAIFVLTTLFLIKTLSAHMDMVKYNNLLMSRGEIRLGLLKPAVGNGYLQQIAIRLVMDGRLRIGLSTNNRELIEEFIDWSKNERMITPFSSLYVREGRALYALGLKNEAFKVLDEGLSLYPDKRDILKTKTMLIAEEIKSKFSFPEKKP